MGPPAALIVTPRHTAADVAAWQTLAAGDLLEAQIRRERLGRLTGDAHDTIRRWHRTHPRYIVSTSWGKDSTTLLHLVLTAGLDRLPTVRYGRNGIPGSADNPDCDLVRDVWLAAWPELAAVYDEVVCYRSLQAEMTVDVDGWRMVGVRADESPTRAVSAAVHGVDGSRSCRPLLRWSTRDVWAYTAVNGLPVHPAYGYLYGDPRHRDGIRVHSLGGPEGELTGRAEWERRYYGHVPRNPQRRETSP